ncbi:hypothetical protein P691DRAFT_824532, partial [Macrolepiota fuliginosa MF-IS2]
YKGEKRRKLLQGHPKCLSIIWPITLSPGSMTQITDKFLKCILEVEIPKVKVGELLLLSGGLCKMLVESACIHKTPVNAAVQAQVLVKFLTPLHEVEVKLMGKKLKLELLDEGLEMVVIWRDLCQELGLVINQEKQVLMHMVNGGSEELEGCVECLEVDVGGIKAFAHAFVVKLVPYCLLLGRPWQKGAQLGKVENRDRSLDVVVTDPLDGGQRVVVSMKERWEE